MANEQQQTQPQVAIPLPKGKKNAVQIGCICMMLSVAMYGLVFATLTAPILEKVDPRHRPVTGNYRYSNYSTHASDAGPCGIEGNSFSVCS